MVSISDIIKAIGPCYNSVDITSIFYEKEDTWNNILTTFYISNEDSTPLDKMIFDGSKIKIVKIQTDLSKLHSYLEALKTGQVYFHGLQVDYENPFDPDSLEVREDWHNNLRQTENAVIYVANRNFNVFNNNPELKQYLDQINPKVIIAGFDNAYDFIAHHAGVRHFSHSNNYDVQIIIPVYFTLDSNIIENRILTTNLSYDPSFNDLQINAIGESGDSRHKIFRNTVEVRDQKMVQIPLTNMPPGSKLKIQLFSQRVPELQIEETIYVPIDQPLLPLSQTYNQFFKLTELENILTNPETLDSRKRSDLFEKAVCDLFSLCGMSTILLGEHEILQLENKTQVGSADILAYDGLEYLFVIDCDIMVPDVKKSSNLVHLCRYLGDIPGIDKVDHIIPVIVSPNSSSNIDSSVLLIDGGMIQRLFKGIHYKTKKELRSILSDAYHQLQFSAYQTFR
jgi:hypothetical protein